MLVAVELDADGLSFGRVNFEVPVGSEPEATNFLRRREYEKRFRISRLAEALIGELIALETVTGVRSWRVYTTMTADVRIFNTFVDIGTRYVVCHEAEAGVAITRRTVGRNETSLAAFLLTALVDLTEGAFISAVTAILAAIAHLGRKKTLSVKARKATLVDVATRGQRRSGRVFCPSAVQLVGGVNTVFSLVAAPRGRNALVIVAPVAGAVARVTVLLVRGVVAVRFAIAHPNLRDAVAGVVAGEFVRGTSALGCTASGLVLVVAAVVLAIAPPEHGDTPAVAAVKPCLRALAGHVAY